MKLEFIKQAGGLLMPADDHTAEKMTKFKTGEQYPVDIKRTRNPQFHRKMFAFFNFCFEHWAGGHEFQDETLQREEFRKELTKLAGFYDQVFDLHGNFTIVAKSLSFASMDQEEFERCYNALIQAAMSNIFRSSDEQTLNRLMSFF